MDNRQSNFDESTGRFVVASDDASINGVKVGRYLQTYSKTRLRSAPRLRLRRDRQRQDDRPRRLRRVLELHARRHLVVEGAEPAVPPVDRRRDHDASAPTLLLEGRPAAASRRRSRPPRPAGSTRSASSTSTSATRYAQQLEPQHAAAARHQLHARGRLRRLAGPRTRPQERPEPGAAGRRRDRLERQPSVRQARRRRCAPSAQVSEHRARSTTTACR